MYYCRTWDEKKKSKVKSHSDTKLKITNNKITSNEDADSLYVLMNCWKASLLSAWRIVQHWHDVLICLEKRRVKKDLKHNTFLYSQQHSNATWLRNCVSRKKRTLLPITFIRDSSPIRWERRHNKWKETPMYVLPIFFISAETTGNFLWIWLVREKEFVSEIIQTENNDVVKPKWLNSPQIR